MRLATRAGTGYSRYVRSSSRFRKRLPDELRSFDARLGVAPLSTLSSLAAAVCFATAASCRVIASRGLMGPQLNVKTLGGRRRSASMDTGTYSRDELRAASDGRWPERGHRCNRCGVLVPVLVELADDDRAKILHLIAEGRVMLARQELIAATGAPPRFAKIWVLHAGRPQARFSGPPCPYCGEPLASLRAKQCLHCHRDWHGVSPAAGSEWTGITKLTMMDALIAQCPSFAPAWNDFLEEWSETDDKPLYLAPGSLARHLIAMLSTGDAAGLKRAFAVVERWLVEGDSYVKEAACVGLLEGLQNTSLYEATSPEQFVPFMHPESLKWWRNVEKFWNGGELISDH
jgi:hypothetical protein